MLILFVFFNRGGSLSFRCKDTARQSICRFLRTQYCPWTAKAFTRARKKKIRHQDSDKSIAKNGRHQAFNTLNSWTALCSQCAPSSQLTLPSTYPTQTRRLWTHRLGHAHAALRLRTTWELQQKLRFKKLHKNSQAAGFKVPSNQTCNIVSLARHSFITSSSALARHCLFLRRRNAFVWLQNRMRLSRGGVKCNQGISAVSVLSVCL